MKQIDEKQLKAIVKPVLAGARPGDWEHTIRTVSFGRYLLKHEKAEESIVIPALYLHDLGWSDVSLDDFMDADRPEEKSVTEGANMHMHFSGVRAEKILDELGIDLHTAKRITYIVSVHDKPETVFSSDDHSAWLVVEADRLDRYGPKSLKRYQTLFGKEYYQGAHGKIVKDFLQKGLETWFKTETGSRLAQKLFLQMPLG